MVKHHLQEFTLAYGSRSKSVSRLAGMVVRTGETSHLEVQVWSRESKLESCIMSVPAPVMCVLWQGCTF